MRSAIVLQALATREAGSVLAHTGRAGSLGWEVEARCGNWDAAEREIRTGYDGLAALGATAYLSSVAGCLAHCLYALGRVEEAEEVAAVSAETAAEDEVMSQVLWRTARAKLLAVRGEFPEAMALAREAVELVLETDTPTRARRCCTSQRCSFSPSATTTLAPPRDRRSTSTSAKSASSAQFARAQLETRATTVAE